MNINVMVTNWLHFHSHWCTHGPNQPWKNELLWGIPTSGLWSKIQASYMLANPRVCANPRSPEDGSVVWDKEQWAWAVNEGGQGQLKKGEEHSIPPMMRKLLEITKLGMVELWEGQDQVPILEELRRDSQIAHPRGWFFITSYFNRLAFQTTKPFISSSFTPMTMRQKRQS